ncbi:hypothetical protein [Asanoa iriomotensis]|uniref:Uncharacterized protein n=1 Tax=Asanoa iriomotensis TaxID=234613 RepID=A0ABQ4BZK2_9ACTN|nr:hypothetical protein [Asanoa iriomotensis]GIF55932.1 hypothetical protein Air01nite_20270 [Asanoa iriomotensis]
MQPTQPGLPQRLARVNPTKAFLGALVVMLAGLFLPGIIGGLVLLILAGAMIALTRMTWYVQAPQTRLVRLVLLTALIGIAVFKIL